MSVDIVIYGTNGSPFVRKVQVLLEEKQIPWMLEEVNVFDPPEWFLSLSPARRIPVMRDRSIATEGADGTLADSSAICGYLEKKYPEVPMYPDDPYELGRALWFEEYADTLLAARIGFGLLRTLVVAPAAGDAPDLERARKAYHQDLPPLFTYLNQEIGDKTFLIGERFSIADIALCAQLSGLHVTRVPLDAKIYPNLSRYMELHLARKSFQDRLESLRSIMPAEEFQP